MQITRQMLMRAVPDLYFKRVDEFVASFNMWAIPFGINTPKRIAQYLAQVFHESGALRYVEEIASGAAYDTGKLAEKLGNTPEKDGDGQRYKGRGFIQLTGLANYKAFKACDLCTEDVVAHPEKVAEFPLNQVASMWFWQSHGLNELAEKDEPLSADVLSETYYKIHQSYYGEAISEPDELIELEWARIPHFYYNFYVYKYACGMSAALKLKDNILSGDPKLIEAYFSFLKAGDSLDVLDIMLNAGVDLSVTQPIEDALDTFGKVVSELESLLMQ